MKDTKIVNKLFRHFKGGYYFVTGTSLNVESEPSVEYVEYVSVSSIPEGIPKFIRPSDNFFEDISDKEGNVTGQKHRFEAVTDFSNTLCVCSMESLIRELQSREDSPLIDMDIVGFNDKVEARSYQLVKIRHVKNRDIPEGEEIFELVLTFDTEEQAISFLKSHKEYCNSNFKLLKFVGTEITF